MAVVPSLRMLNGLRIPRLGLGTWMSSESQLEDALNTALDTGYRLIDTAYVYENEKYIGNILKKWISSEKIKREDLFVVTKLPICGVHRDRVELFIKKSLENLQLDYLDLYLIHFPIGTNYVGEPVTPPDKLVLEPSDHEGVWRKMEEQVIAGRTKNIGLSNFSMKQVDNIFKLATIKPSCLEIELHVSFQQTCLVNYCHQHEIIVIAYSPLGALGFNDFLKSINLETKDIHNMLKHPVVVKVAEKHKKTSAQVMLRFLIENNIVPIPKSVTPSRIVENFNVFDFSLDTEDMMNLLSLNLGKEGRVCDFQFFPYLQDHPDWPFPKK